MLERAQFIACLQYCLLDCEVSDQIYKICFYRSPQIVLIFSYRAWATAALGTGFGNFFLVAHSSTVSL